MVGAFFTRLPLPPFASVRRRLGLTAWLAVCASRAVGQPPAAVSPATTIHREYSALNRHDLDGVFAVYADSVWYSELSDSGVVKLTTKKQLSAEFAPFLARNPRGHVTLTHEIDLGPFVIADEVMSGAADGKPFELIDVSEVRGGRVVAELETGNIAGTPPADVQQADLTVRRADDAFARGDAAASAPAYAEPVLFHVWGEDSVQHVTRAKLQQGFQNVLAGNPGMRFVVVDRIVAGPFVVVHERLTGMVDGKLYDSFDVMEVRGGHIVAEWECPWQLSDGGM